MSSGGGGGGGGSGGGGGGASGGAGGSGSSVTGAGTGAVARGARVRPPTGAAGALPQEAVTPTRRELRANNVDWIPVSEYNSRTHNRSRKPINALPENNEYVEIDSSVIPEISNRFVPVRPQPRTLVLRQRDIMESQDDASYNPILSGHSPHTSHTAIMIVNPTTPNSNFPTQNNLANGHSNDNRINSKNICTNHEVNSSMSNHATLIGPFPVLTNNKSSNICGDNQDSIHQNGHMSNEIQHSENGLSHTKIARTIGETLVSACPDTSRVEQRLGQIQEYIRVTASLVDSMRNSEDELRNRLASLRRSNLLLTKGIYQDVNNESNSDLDELLQSLQDLKDSEKKLESMLQTTLQLTEAGKSKENDEKLEDLNDAAIEISEITLDDKNSEVLNVVNDSENVNQDAPRSYSVQSGGSAYSDNELWQNDLDMKMEVSQLQAAFQEQQKKLLKYQAESREKAEAHSSNNEHFDNVLMDNVREQSNNHQPLLMQNAGRAFSSNQIGVATTLPHIIDDKEYMKNQMQLRRFGSHEREPNEATASRDMSGNRSKEQSFVSEADMLRDLKMRRQHLENQVAKIQSLHVATTSLVEAVAEEQSGIITPDDQSLRGTGMWEESEDSIPEDDGIAALDSLKSKMEAVNVVKVELEKLKSMLRTVDSIQNNFGINSTFENDDSYDAMIENQDIQNLNHNQLSESPFNNVMRSKVEPTSSANVNRSISQSPKNPNTQQGLPRLQNCISTGSGKCTNVNDQQQRRDSISAGLATIQQLTQKMKQEAQEISTERQRIKHAFNRDTNDSRASSSKSDDKRRSNSIEKTSHVYPIESGPLERKQLALKAELEAKKKQLERLMSKEVDHRTNQQIVTQCDVENTSKTPSSSNDNGFATQEASPPVLQHSQSSHSNRFDDSDVYPCHIRSEADNGYSSDQDGEDDYGLSSIPQVNINQLNDRCLTKRSSQNSSIESFKMNYNDSTQSIDSSNQTVKHNNNNHSNIFDTPNAEKQRNKNEGIVNPVLPHCSNSSKVAQDICNEPRNLRESCQRQRSSSREIESNILPKSQPLIALPTGSTTPLQTVPNKSVNPTDSIEITSHLDSGSSSGDQELPDIPNPMPELSLRRTVIKSDQDNHNPNVESRQWQNPHSESQVTMWWHNKANQLQQQLEMINNLCQSLLQDRLTNQSPPSTSSSLPHPLGNAAIMPNCPSTFMLPYNFGVSPMSDQMGVPWWGVTQQQLALQQQQLAAQQQQLAANSWSNSQCVQHLLSQQREISSLKNSINILEDKLQMLNMGYPHPNPNLPNIDVAQNSSVSRAQSQAWTNPQMNSLANLIDSQQLNEFNAPWLQQANRHNLYHNRPQFPSKKTPVVPPYPTDHINNHMSVFPTQAMMNDQISNQMGMSVAPNNLSVGNQPGIVFNNCLPTNQINPNLLNNQNMNSNAMLNMPPHSSIHNTHAMAMHTMSGGSTQSLTGQNIALNNQVPPGNRANNYWDNFRSYSRQNLLSGNNKTNAESVAQSHGHHPLPERSHNTLRISSSTVPSQTQAVNTPKRNLNNQLGNSTLNQFHNNPTLQANCQENVARGRRNLSNEVTFNTPPDVLNMNSDAVPIANAPLNVEEYNRTNNSVNLNINRSCVLDSDSELVLSNSNNLNTPRASFTHKKKSSSKLPAKNSSNAGNYSMESLQNKNVESDITDHNLVSTSSIVKQKSPTKLFDLLRENVYSEVSALISANESRPHFLIQLFRDLQQISSDTLRQRTLQSIQELVTRYLSTVEVESFGSAEDPKNRVTSSSEDQICPTTGNETEIFTLDNNNEIIRFIFAHHADPCTSELFQSLRTTIYSIAGNIPKKIDDSLLACFNKYPGCTLMDIGDELIMIISRITSESKKKSEINVDASNEGFPNDIIVHDGQIDAVESNDAELHSHLVDIAQANFNEPSELPSCSISSVSKHVEINPDNSACSSSYNASSNELKIDLIESVETCNGDLAEADQSRHGNDSSTANGGFENLLPDIVDMDEQTPTEAEAEWLRMDRMPAHMESDDCIESQNDVNQS
ncbi:combover isoform X3 [Arctopsyche grandis]|uniref:combover isoform X3 n=1 Tax=Arctopsyche grandis TaxID=121162 RepID=UPI00406D81FC